MFIKGTRTKKSECFDLLLLLWKSIIFISFFSCFFFSMFKSDLIFNRELRLFDSAKPRSRFDGSGSETDRL